MHDANLAHLSFSLSLSLFGPSQLTYLPPILPAGTRFRLKQPIKVDRLAGRVKICHISSFSRANLVQTTQPEFISTKDARLFLDAKMASSHYQLAQCLSLTRSSSFEFLYLDSRFRASKPTILQLEMHTRARGSTNKPTQ